MIGPCAKRRVVATLVTADGRHTTAENLCGNAQPACPRLPGEGYAKCNSVCWQKLGHAEVQVIGRALNLGWELAGAVCYVHHHYACADCIALAARHGVRLVFTAPADSEPTRV